MNTKNPYIKWAIIGILVLVVLLDLYLILRKKSPPQAVQESLPRVKTEYTQIEKGKNLYELETKLRDPFKGTVAKAWELEDSLKIKKLEVELTKMELERRKLLKELGKLGYVAYKRKGYAPLPRLKGVIETGKGRKALISYLGRERWLKEGESFGRYRVEEIGESYVRISRGGKVYKLSLNKGG